MMRSAVVFLLCLIPATMAVAGPRELLDVAYVADETATANTLSVFLPEDPRNAPVLVFFHGGGWRTGDKASLYDFARRLSSEGVIVALPDYRLAPASRFPAQVDDAAAAVAWVEKRLPEWKAERRCLFVGGHSAGGHLAALLATSPGSFGTSGKARDIYGGVVAFSGVFRIAPAEGGATPAFIASVFGEDEDVWRDASPIVRLASMKPETPLPPFALIWSAGEDPLAVKESVDFARALREAKRKVITREIPGSDHEAGMNAVSAALFSELSGGECGGRAPEQ